jgi:hypothetical protein
MLGVHPAAALMDPDTAASANAAACGLGLPGRVPVYVPRDLDARLAAAVAHALAQGGLVLLRGDSTAGKSHAAFEAIRRLPGDLRLMVPTQRGSVQALLDGGVELHEVVVWLNDLERYWAPTAWTWDCCVAWSATAGSGCWCWPRCGPVSTTPAARSANVITPHQSVTYCRPNGSC